MGHLLSSVNPEAAAAIKPEEPVVADLPHVGSIVSYFPRPGEGRGGRGEFAMFVTGVAANGTLTGIVFFDAQDLLDVARLPRRTETHRWPAWDWVDEPVYGNEDFQEDMLILREDQRKLRDELAIVRSMTLEMGQRLVVVESNELIVAKIESLQVALSDLDTRLTREIKAISHLSITHGQFEHRVAKLEENSERITINPSNALQLADIEARLDVLEDNRGGAPAGRKSVEYRRQESAPIGKDRQGSAQIGTDRHPPPLKYEQAKPKPKAKRKKKRKQVKKPLLPPAED